MTDTAVAVRALPFFEHLPILSIAPLGGVKFIDLEMAGANDLHLVK
jgi:hypothetical protein